MPDGEVIWRRRLARTGSVDRTSYLLEICRGRTVLHLGCVDHPFLAERLRNGDLLHARLDGVAKELYGVDRDTAGLEQLRGAGFQNLFTGDAQQLQDLDLERRFEIVVASEIVEHLPNPGLFLNGVRTLLANGGKLVVTVPSAQSIRLAANALRHREVVHPDHVAYYSPQTLRRLLETHGFRVVEIYPYWARPPAGRSLTHRVYDQVIGMTRFVSPWLGEGLVATATLEGP